MEPKPAILIVDTREQLPYDFVGCNSQYVDFDIRREALPAGDYLAQLAEDDSPEEIAIVERKSLPDLLGTLTHGRVRFQAELDKLQAYGYSAIVAETDIPQIVERTSRPGCKIGTRSIIASLLAFSQRHGVHVIFASDRRYGEILTYRILERWVRDRISARKLEAVA